MAIGVSEEGHRTFRFRMVLYALENRLIRAWRSYIYIGLLYSEEARISQMSEFILCCLLLLKLKVLISKL